MQLLIGAFSSFLTVLCFIGGLFLAKHEGNTGFERLLGYTFWIFPLATAIVCFTTNPDQGRSSESAPEADDRTQNAA